MKMIICEKPSLGKTVAKAIGIEKWEDGYVKCKDNYIVTWGFGHLFTLYDIKDYENVEKLSWQDIKLPYFPKDFLYKLKTDKDGGVKKQFNVIKKLCKENQIDTVINCGDADREGQIIVDIIMDKIGWNGSKKRLWLPEQTDQTIRRQLLKIEDNNKYLNLANEGYARTFMDWLLGINLTIYVSNKTGTKMNVGRVLIPIVKFIYDRDKSIKDFIKTIYWQAESVTEKDGVKITLTKEQKYNNKRDCEELVASLPATAVVSKIEKTEVKKTPKKLFSLSKLQSELSSKHKMSFKTSLDLIQKLYEAGFITYPRTNTEYLAEEEIDKVQEVINTIKGIPLKVTKTKRIFDNSKIESHSAIIPTIKVPSANELGEKEKLVYETIRNRFISNFLDEETVIEKTTMTINAGSEEFKLKGEVIVKEGFLKYEPEKIENQLPKLVEKEEFPTAFKAVEKETQPPKKVTEKELANYLKNPFRKEQETEDEEYKAILNGVEIGTEATRTAIIENAKVLLNDKTIHIKKLKSKEGKEYEADFRLKDDGKYVNLERVAFADSREVIGTCPRCGKNIYEGDKAFYCEGYKEDPKCGFTIWKEQKFPATKITKANAKALLNNKDILVKGLKSKAGKDYDAYFTLVDDGKYVNLKMTKFADTKKK